MVPCWPGGVCCGFHKHTLSFLHATKVAIESARSKKVRSYNPYSHSPRVKFLTGRYFEGHEPSYTDPGVGSLK